MKTYNRQILSTLEKLPNSISFCLFVVSFVAVFRFIGEWLILDGQNYFTFGGLPHQIAFYLAMFVLNVFNMSLILKKDWSHLYGIASIGILLGLLPIIIDASIINVGYEKYQYFQDFNVLFFPETQPLGELIAIWLWIIGFAVYIYIASSSWLKAFVGLILTYCVAQFVGWGSFVCKNYIMSIMLLKMPADYFYTVWWLLIAFVVTVLGNWSQFKSVFQRIHHTFIWGGLVLLGAKLTGYIESLTVLRALIMIWSFILIMLVNDYFDKETDRINNRESAVTWDMVIFVIYLHIVLILTSGGLDIVFGCIVFLFFILGLAYSIPKILQLKRNYFLGSLVEGVGAALCVLAGGTQFGPPLNQYFLLLVILIGAGFMLSSNIKDYKDFKGDYESGTLTLYVFFHNKGWPLQKVNYLMALVILMTHMASCVVLYLLGVRTSMLLMAIVLSFVPSILLLKITKPSLSVKYSLLAITVYVFYLGWAMPRLPM